MTKIAVLGDGGWGTAISLLLFGKGYSVCLWSNFSEYADILNNKRENIKFLPGVSIPRKIVITPDIDAAVSEAEIIVLAVPSKFIRDICKKVKSTDYRKAKCILSAVKGVETKSLQRMSEIVKDELPGVSIAVLSGPSHAEEAAKDLPTAVVTASEEKTIAAYIQKVFANERFRVYTSEDMIGVELGGALKNVIAIAVGVCQGMNLGDSAKSALMTRGLAEITRLGVVMGGKRETFAGLAGIGDIIVTCTSKYGRNLWFGNQIAQGNTIDNILASTEMVVEGVTTSQAVYELGRKYSVDMPISNEVYKVIYEKKSFEKALQDLMLRTPKPETV